MGACRNAAETSPSRATQFGRDICSARGVRSIVNIGDGVFFFDLASTSYAWPFLSVDPPCWICFSDDVVVDCRRIYFVVDVM